MKRPITVLGLVFVAGVLDFPGRTSAGPEKIAFPANFKAGVLYTTVDRHDIER